MDPHLHLAGTLDRDDSAAILRAKAAAIWDVQASLLRLYCELEKAADEVEREQALSAESTRLLREARRWLGRGVRETTEVEAA